MRHKDGPVIVRNCKSTRTNIDILQVEFTQETLRPIDDPKSLLNVMMQGHKSFGSPTQKRVVFQNMTRKAFDDFGLKIGGEFPVVWQPRLVVHEFCEGDEIPLSIRGFYSQERFYAKTWVESGVTKYQQPKMTPYIEGKEQVVLMRNDEPIYRMIYFTIIGMDQLDYFIKHDNFSTTLKQRK